MLVAPFGHGVKRQDTGMTYASKPSISGEAGMATALPPGFAGASNPNVIFNNIQDTSTKRIATLEYLRKVCVFRLMVPLALLS